MITAIDTTFCSIFFGRTKNSYEASAAALEDCAASGSLVICDLVYGELCIHFTTQRECDRFLESLSIRVESLSKEAHFLASRAWRPYRKPGG